MARAIKYNAFGYGYIRNICRNQTKRGGGFNSAKEILSEVFKKYGLPQVQERTLKVYETNLNE